MISTNLILPFEFLSFNYLRMFLSQLIIIATIHLLAVVSPGPDFAVVMRNSFIFSHKIGIYTALGVALDIMVHVFYSLFGVAVIISQSILLFNIIKYLGAAYLIYIGIKALGSKASNEPKNIKDQKLEEISSYNAIKQGFITNVLNPKATLFFFGVFTQVINPSTPILYQLVYGLEMTIVTFLWFTFVALVITNPIIKSRFDRYKHWVDRIMGAALILLGLKVATSS